MKQADIRFYAELNDFLPAERRNRTSTYAFGVSGSVKDAIEALGVPHTEVDLILANGNHATGAKMYNFVNKEKKEIDLFGDPQTLLPRPWRSTPPHNQHGVWSIWARRLRGLNQSGRPEMFDKFRERRENHA
jgi:hypothetical protein